MAHARSVEPRKVNFNLPEASNSEEVLQNLKFGHLMNEVRENQTSDEESE
jgi:hypothetical protein